MEICFILEKCFENITNLRGMQKAWRVWIWRFGWHKKSRKWYYVYTYNRTRSLHRSGHIISLLFIHNLKPTESFRYAVLHGHKPNTCQYREILKEIICLSEKRSKAINSIKCSNCGEIFEGFIAYKVSRRKGDVQVYKDRFVNKMLNKEKYIGVCIKCLHYSEV